MEGVPIQENQAQKTIPVVNKYGEFGTIDASESHLIGRDFRLQTPEEIKEASLKAQYGEGLGNEVRAGAEAVARGASFGISDQFLTKSGLVTPESMKARQEYNPVSSGVGEVAGAIAPALLSGGESAIGSVARGIGKPVQLAAKFGQGASKAIAPLAEKAAGALVGAETSPLANKIISSGLSHGFGSAIEASAYGLGQSVSEEALGDPDLNAEKVLSNIGFAAALGGTFGATFGGGAELIKGLKNKTPSVGEMLGKGAPQTFEDAVNDGHFNPGEKESILDGLRKQKLNAGEIDAAAKDLGVETFIPQTSGAETVQRTHDMLVNSPSHYGEIERQKIQNAMETVGAKVQETLTVADAPTSLAQMGDNLKGSLSNKFEAEYKPTKDLYDYLGENSQGVPITSKSTSAIKSNILKIAKEESMIVGTPAYDFVQNVANSLDQVQDLATLRNFRTNLYRNAPNDAKWVAGAIKEKLDNLEINAVKRLAGTMKTPVAKDKILNLLEVSENAKAGYKKLYARMNEFGDVLGKSKIRGPQDFMNFLQEGNTSERFAEKLFQKKNSAFTSFFKENFPKEWETIAGYQKNKILEASMKDGKLNVNSVMRSVNKLEPEMKAALFNSGELKTLSSAQTYMDAFPKKFNPSGSAHTLGWMNALQNPVSAGIATARDYAIKTGFEKLGLSGENMAKVDTLSKIERKSQEIGRKVTQAAASLFKTGKQAAIASSALPEFADHKTAAPKIEELVSNPQMLIDKLEKGTEYIHNSAPKHAQSIQMAMTRAATFLHTKLPKHPNPKPMSGKFIPSAAEISKFNRYYQTIQNPVHTMHHLKTGMLMPEHMEALSQVYPSLLASMQTEVMDHLTDYMAKNEGSSIPYQKRMAISMFLGQNLDPSLEQMAVASNQSRMTGEKNPEDQLANPAAPTQGGMKNLSLSNRSQTSNQSLSSGDQDA